MIKDAEKVANGLNREDGEKPSRTRRRNPALFKGTSSAGKHHCCLPDNGKVAGEAGKPEDLLFEYITAFSW